MTYATIDPVGNRTTSSIPFCGYAFETLRDMAANGYTMEINGTKTKFPTRAEYDRIIANAAPQKKR